MVAPVACAMRYARRSSGVSIFGWICNRLGCMMVPGGERSRRPLPARTPDHAGESESDLQLQPTVLGRKLPPNDWEGDDFTPGASGRYVTCLDTAVGRAVCFATNGRICKDGRVYRASIGYDPDGITLSQAKNEVAAVAHLPLIIPVGWSRANVQTHLRYARGLVVTGLYSIIPRAFRYQLGADFGHGMFFSHMSVATGNFRGWDALNPDTTTYGRWYPPDVFWAFINSYSFAVAYVPLQTL